MRMLYKIDILKTVIKICITTSLKINDYNKI